MFPAKWYTCLKNFFNSVNVSVSFRLYKQYSSISFVHASQNFLICVFNSILQIIYPSSAFMLCLIFLFHMFLVSCLNNIFPLAKCKFFKKKCSYIHVLLYCCLHLNVIYISASFMSIIHYVEAFTNISLK